MWKLPAWVEGLAQAVGSNITPEIDKIGTSYCVEPRASRRSPWEICVFPTRVELLAQGPDDGRRVRVAICTCLAHISDIFDELPHLDWISPSRYDGNLDGPHVRIEGRYRRHKVVVRIFDRPPRQFGTVTVLDVASGECHLREDNNARGTACR